MIKQCSRCGQIKPSNDFYKVDKKSIKCGFSSWCKQCFRKYNREAMRKYRNEHPREYYKKLRLEVLIHYGGNPPKCACCGETIIEFLTIDHIHGKGRKHRTEVGHRGSSFYCWLRKNGFPDGYRVLCYNCNCAKGAYGECPHERFK